MKKYQIFGSFVLIIKTQFIYNIYNYIHCTAITLRPNVLKYYGTLNI